MSTVPTPPPSYACLTELVQASVRASLRSCRVSSERGRTPAIAVRARRPSVMYSGRAGIVRRTERPSSLIATPFPMRRRALTREGVAGRRRRSRVRRLAGRLGPLAEPNAHVTPRRAALDREARDLPRGEGVRHDPHDILRARDL